MRTIDSFVSLLLLRNYRKVKDNDRKDNDTEK